MTLFLLQMPSSRQHNNSSQHYKTRTINCTTDNYGSLWSYCIWINLKLRIPLEWSWRSCQGAFSSTYFFFFSSVYVLCLLCSFVFLFFLLLHFFVVFSVIVFFDFLIEIFNYCLFFRLIVYLFSSFGNHFLSADKELEKTWNHLKTGGFISLPFPL